MTNEQLNNIVSYLEGSCNSLEDAVTTLGLPELTVIEARELDELIFLCEICSWWYPIEEMDNDETCIDCSD